MNRAIDRVADSEAATDQLVDEICQRLATLFSLVDLSLGEAGPPVAAIRRCAAELVGRLTGPTSPSVALSIARALWPVASGVHIPPAWWTTPLGALLARSLDTRVPAPAGMASPPRPG
jgi:hypothetical protein